MFSHAVNCSWVAIWALIEQGNTVRGVSAGLLGALREVCREAGRPLTRIEVRTFSIASLMCKQTIEETGNEG